MTKKAKSVIMTSLGKSVVHLVMERDGFNSVKGVLNMRLTVDST